jgi:hypothetical protein
MGAPYNDPVTFQQDLVQVILNCRLEWTSVFDLVDENDEMGLYLATIAMLDRSLVRMDPCVLGGVISAVSLVRHTEVTLVEFDDVTHRILNTKRTVDQTPFLSMEFLAFFSTVHTDTTVAFIRNRVARARALLID